MNKNYETVFIINPVLSEKQVEDTVKKYKKQLDGKKVKFVCNESLGFKELAYPINKKNSGFYHLFQYESDATNGCFMFHVYVKLICHILSTHYG